MSASITIADDDEVDPLASSDVISPGPTLGNRVTLDWKTPIVAPVKSLAGDLANLNIPLTSAVNILPVFHGRDPPDQASGEGKFTWIEMLDLGFLPVLTRCEADGSRVKYVSVKMAEKLISPVTKNLPSEVLTKMCEIYSHKVTDAEAKLLYEINQRHCDNKFGRNDQGFFNKDILVRSDDLGHFLDFLLLCHKKMVLKKSSESDRCGFLRVGGENDLPYVRMKHDNKEQEYIPTFYFEGLSTTSRKEARGWDWAYLKFCCKAQGVKDEYLSKSSCPVISLAFLKSNFSEGTSYEEYWPYTDFVNKVFSKKYTEVGSWTKLVLNYGDKFPGKLVQLKDFPVQPSAEQPYKAERAVIEKMKISAVNTRPYQFSELMVTLPSLVEQLLPSFSEQQVGEMLISSGTILYSGNSSHKEILRAQGWEDRYESMPLVAVNDLLKIMPIIKKLNSTLESAKRSIGRQ